MDWQRSHETATPARRTDGETSPRTTPWRDRKTLVTPTERIHGSKPTTPAERIHGYRPTTSTQRPDGATLTTSTALSNADAPSQQTGGDATYQKRCTHS